MSKPSAIPRTAAVLPAASVDKLAPWLRRAGYRIVQLCEHPTIVVVDFVNPQSREDLKALRCEAGGARLGVFAVVGDQLGEACEALAAGADSFVAAGSIEREFDLRLEGVRQLAASRNEQARREKDLAVLLDLTAHYASALDVATLLHDVTRRLADELSIDRCALVLIDEERGVGHIVAASDDSAVHDLRIELARYPEIRESIKTCCPVVVDDVGSHPLLGEVKEMVAQRGIASLAAVPLTVQKKTLGVLLLRSSAGSRFSPHEISFAWTVAHATAIALRNARMLEGLRGQAELAEAQVAELARYEEFFQYISDGMAILDESGAILSLNPAGAEVFGTAVEKAKSLSFDSFAAPISRGAISEMLDKVRKGNVCRDVDIEMQRLDETALTLSICASHVREGRIIVSFRNVTEQREIERELLKTKEFLEKLINSSVDAIVAADQKGTLILFNRSAERILGYPSREVIGKLAFKDLFAEGLGTKIIALLNSGEHGGVGQLEPIRAELRTKENEMVPVLMSAAHIYEAELPVASVAVFNDLRERTRLEAKLWHAQERLKEAEKHAVVAEFAGATAHELNQPLTAVMGWAEMLKMRLRPDDPSYKPVEVIFNEAERMKEIVRRIGRSSRHKTKPYVMDSVIERQILDFDAAKGDDD